MSNTRQVLDRRRQRMRKATGDGVECTVQPLAATKNLRGARKNRSLVCHHEITPMHANPREWTPIRVHSRALAAPLTKITSSVQSRNVERNWSTLREKSSRAAKKSMVSSTKARRNDLDL